MTPENEVYKLIGPVLVKQDQQEAKANVDQRLGLIQGDMWVTALYRPSPGINRRRSENEWRRRLRRLEGNSTERKQRCVLIVLGCTRRLISRPPPRSSQRSRGRYNSSTCQPRDLLLQLNCDIAPPPISEVGKNGNPCSRVPADRVSTHLICREAHTSRHSNR